MNSKTTVLNGFTEAKRKLLAALESGDYQHEIRNNIDVKNALATGEISASDLALIVRRANGLTHTMSPLHGDVSVIVHLIKSDGWYIKFYFLDPTTIFISVHQ